MTAGELITLLQKVPEDYQVMYYWDGAARSLVEEVYLGNGYPEYLSDKTQIVVLTSEEGYYSPIEDCRRVV